jgi:hypothetical protein
MGQITTGEVRQQDPLKRRQAQSVVTYHLVQLWCLIKSHTCHILGTGCSAHKLSTNCIIWNEAWIQSFACITDWACQHRAHLLCRVKVGAGLTGEQRGQNVENSLRSEDPLQQFAELVRRRLASALIISEVQEKHTSSYRRAIVSRTARAWMSAMYLTMLSSDQIQGIRNHFKGM